jgi:energy-converting hydrogenase Eha subunit A
MDILGEVIIAGLSVAFILGAIDDLVGKYISTKLVRLVLTVPLSVLFISLLGTYTFGQLVVLGTAAGFFSLSALLLVNRPVSIQSLQRRR